MEEYNILAKEEFKKRINFIFPILKQQFMVVFYIYITIWLVFGGIYWYIANATSGEAFLFREDILVKAKNVSFQKEAKVRMNYDITKRLISNYDKSMMLIRKTKGDTPIINYNLLSESGLTPIGLNWSNYYITKFMLDGYNFCSARAIINEKLIGSIEYTKLEFNIHKIEENDIPKTSHNQLLVLTKEYKEKIIETKSYYVWIKSDLYGLNENDWSLFGEGEYIELDLAKQFLSLPVNYLDNDILILYNYETNNEFRYSLADFLYFSAVTISTLGYGDILPNLTAIRVLVMIETLLGMILIAIFVSCFYGWLKEKN